MNSPLQINTNLEEKLSIIKLDSLNTSKNEEVEDKLKVDIS